MFNIVPQLRTRVGKGDVSTILSPDTGLYETFIGEGPEWEFGEEHTSYDEAVVYHKKIVEQYEASQKAKAVVLKDSLSRGRN